MPQKNISFYRENFSFYLTISNCRLCFITVQKYYTPNYRHKVLQSGFRLMDSAKILWHNWRGISLKDGKVNAGRSPKPCEIFRNICRNHICDETHAYAHSNGYRLEEIPSAETPLRNSCPRLSSPPYHGVPSLLWRVFRNVREIHGSVLFNKEIWNYADMMNKNADKWKCIVNHSRKISFVKQRHWSYCQSTSSYN